MAVVHHLTQPRLGNVERPLRDAGITLDERFRRRGDELPALGEIDGIVSLGGEQSAVSPDAAVGEEIAWLRDAVEAGLPVLGICLGGQMLASALGAAVWVSRRRALEWRELALLDPHDPLVGGLVSPLPALHWNHDAFALPEGAVQLFGSPPGADGVSGFRYGERAWGLQFHPDVDAGMLERWYEEFPDYVRESGVPPSAAREADARCLPVHQQAADALFGAFARVVLTRARERRVTGAP